MVCAILVWILRDQLDGQEGQDIDEDGAVMAATWIPVAYRFTRHDPYDYGSIDYLIDSGQVLKKLSWPEQSDGVERCREVVRGVLDRRSSMSSLADVVGDAEVASLAAALEEAAPGLFPSGFRSLVIFCRWKELFHEWREAVDLQELGKEARDLVAAGIDFRSVRESLWLLGCFAGHERVAPMRYAAEGHSWWCGAKLSLAKITGPATGTAREGEMSGESNEHAVAAGEHATTAEKPGTARAGKMRREAGERAAAADKPEAIRDGAVSGEARKPAGTPGTPETVRDGAMSGEGREPAAAAAAEAVPAGAMSGEGGEQTATAEKPGMVPADEVPEAAGEPAVPAEKAEKGLGWLPLEPTE